MSMTIGHCQEASAQDAISPASPGDRIGFSPIQAATPSARTLSKEVYRLGPGDALAVNVQSRTGVNYLVNPENATKEDPTVVTVSPSGGIYLPLLGNINVTGKTVAEVEEIVRTGLKKYYKHFTAEVSLSRSRTLQIWVGGEVDAVGPQALSRVETASSAVLKSRVHATGSVRRIEVVRDGKKRMLDLFRVMVFGDNGSDIELESGDMLYVPPVSRYVEVGGEVIRGGKYEMVTLAGRSDPFRVRDLLELAVGPTPMAAFSKAFVDRIGPDGKKISIKLDLGRADAPGLDMPLQSGDIMQIPSVASFQPIVRMIGEFKGDGVYQRVVSQSSKQPASVGVEVQNKSGIYHLKQGQTVADVIIETGGVTPQADLKRAHILRKEKDQTTEIPVDLERLLVRNDRTADVALERGDTLVLPAMEDKVYVFGEVVSPGSYPYSPSRRLIDYLGDAGGPKEKSRLSIVRVVRGGQSSPVITTLNLREALAGKSSIASNPVLEAGDLIFVPSKTFGGWQDLAQAVVSAYSLSSLLGWR